MWEGVRILPLPKTKITDFIDNPELEAFMITYKGKTYKVKNYQANEEIIIKIREIVNG
jgi:hypothetical protein